MASSDFNVPVTKAVEYTRIEGQGVYLKTGRIVEIFINTGNHSDGDVLFTLPEGYRPSYLLTFKGEGGTVNQITTLRINQNGQVMIYGASNGGAMVTAVYIAA